MSNFILGVIVGLFFITPIMLLFGALVTWLFQIAIRRELW